MDIMKEIDRRIVFWDGGMGSLLQERGLQPGELPETWNIRHPDIVTEIHREYIEAGADIIMLDNMSCEMMREAVSVIGKRALVEASGNVSLETVYDIACTGVDIISVGELTHSVKAVDISMRFVD